MSRRELIYAAGMCVEGSVELAMVKLHKPVDYIAVDTGAEAVLAAFLAGQRIECKDTLGEGTKMRESGTGYEVFTHPVLGVRHAELAWAINRWLEPQLSPDELRCVANARTRTMQQITAEPDLALAPAELSAIGWPSRAAQAALLSQLSIAIS